MTFTFRPAKREAVGLILGFAGGTGSGKTYSALRVAKGISGNKPFALIDTEASRALYYADEFSFEHGALKPPFRPDAYIEAIQVADKKGYPVIVVDSMSHVWAGDGGILDWQEDELQRMAKDDYKRRESCKMAAWIKPKMAHKKMVQKLLQVRAHLILCFRAEEKIEMRRNAKGKIEIVPKEGPTGLKGWMPVCEKSLPFELTASFLLLADKPGVPHPIKLQEQHKAFFPKGELLGEKAGERIAAWAGTRKIAPTTDDEGEWKMTPDRIEKIRMAAKASGWNRGQAAEWLQESYNCALQGIAAETAYDEVLQHFRTEKPDGSLVT